jgi:uncharacterized protein (TIGR02217 family)
MRNKFCDERFPEDISLGAIGGPEYRTEILSAVSGLEYRFIRWGSSRARYNISYGIKTKEHMDQFIAFFRAKKGRAVGFRFKDWTDYKAENQRLLVIDGSNKNFQIIKRYLSGEEEEVRVITKPVRDTLKIVNNNKILTSADYEIDYNKGIISLLRPIEGSDKDLFATFEFDVPVRFDSDHLQILLEGRDLFSCKNISLVEIKSSQLF